jgi:Protein of unknown function (DUF1488)
MGQLAFLEEGRHFDGACIRFVGRDGSEEIVCGVTLFALQHCDPHLPKHGLISSEAFMAAFDRLLLDIHQAAREKHMRGLLETEGPVKIMVHRQDLSP